jgi:hypothetical protein
MNPLSAVIVTIVVFPPIAKFATVWFAFGKAVPNHFANRAEYAQF